MRVESQAAATSEPGATWIGLHELLWLQGSGAYLIAARSDRESNPHSPGQSRSAFGSDVEAVDADRSSAPNPTIATPKAPDLRAREMTADLSQTSRLNISSTGVPFRIPSARALPEGRLIQRAIRDLKRKRASRVEVAIDEDLTVQRIAETNGRIAEPVFSPRRERWLTLDLVVEEAPAMLLWRETVTEICRLCERMGAFRNVRLWYLNAEQSTLRAPRNEQIRSLNELIGNDGNRLTWILSPFLSEAWKSPTLNARLQRIAGAQALSFLHMLPRRMWSQCALSPRRPENSWGTVTCDSIGAANQAYRFCSGQSATDEYGSALPGQAGLPVPVITLAPDSLFEFAKLLTRPGKARVPAIRLHLPSSAFLPHMRPVDNEAASNARDDSLDAKWSRFIRHASGDAISLAKLLSQIPLHLPLVRLVQHNLTRSMISQESANAVLAEIFLSGLVTRVRSPPGKATVEFDFVADIRSRLERITDRSDVIRVGRLMAEFIAERRGQAHDFWALLEQGPDAVEIDGIPALAYVCATLREAFVHSGHESSSLATRSAEILWIDDKHRWNADHIGELERVGCQVHCVTNNTDALALLDGSSISIDLIITNIDRYSGSAEPGGLSLIRSLADRENRPWLVVVSAVVDEFVGELLLLGVDSAWDRQDWSLALNRITQLVKEPRPKFDVWPAPVFLRAAGSLLSENSTQEQSYWQNEASAFVDRALHERALSPQALRDEFAAMVKTLLMATEVRFSTTVPGHISKKARSVRTIVWRAGTRGGVLEADVRHLVAPTDRQIGWIQAAWNRLSDRIDSIAGLSSLPLKELAILWVDDQPKNILSFRNELREMGAEVFLVRSTREALALIGEANEGSRARFDLMITDLSRRGVQGLPGLPLIAEIDQIAPWLGTIVVSHNADRFRREAENLGAIGCYRPDQWSEALPAVISFARERQQRPGWTKPIWPLNVMMRAFDAIAESVGSGLALDYPHLDWSGDQFVTAWIDQPKFPREDASEIFCSAVSALADASVTSFDLGGTRLHGDGRKPTTLISTEDAQVTLGLVFKRSVGLTERQTTWLQSALVAFAGLQQIVRSEEAAALRLLEPLFGLAADVRVGRAVCLYQHIARALDFGPGRLHEPDRIGSLALVVLGCLRAKYGLDRWFHCPTVFRSSSENIWLIQNASPRNGGQQLQQLDWQQARSDDVMLVAGLLVCALAQPMQESALRQQALSVATCLLEGLSACGATADPSVLVQHIAGASTQPLFPEARLAVLVSAENDLSPVQRTGLRLLTEVLHYVGVRTLISSSAADAILPRDALLFGPSEAARHLLIFGRTIELPNRAEPYIASEDTQFIHDLVVQRTHATVGYGNASDGLGKGRLRYHVDTLEDGLDQSGFPSQVSLDQFAARVLRLFEGLESLLAGQTAKDVVLAQWTAPAISHESARASWTRELRLRGIYCAESAIRANRLPFSVPTLRWVVCVPNAPSLESQLSGSQDHELIVWLGGITEKARRALKSRDFVLVSLGSSIEDTNELVREIRIRAIKVQQRTRSRKGQRDKFRALNQQTSSQLENSETRAIGQRRAPTDDPHKFQFGGFPSRHRRTLSASVSTNRSDPDWFNVSLTVRGRPDWPLTGEIVFHLHPTFDEDVVPVKARRTQDGNEAELRFDAWGAFTVGVECDDGLTRLELDLAELTSAPKKFREA